MKALKIDKTNFIKDLTDNSLPTDLKFCVCDIKCLYWCTWICQPTNYKRLNLLRKCVPRNKHFPLPQILEFLRYSGLRSKYSNKSTFTMVYYRRISHYDSLCRKIEYQRIPFEISRKFKLCEKCYFINENFLNLLNRLEHNVYEPYVLLVLNRPTEIDQVRPRAIRPSETTSENYLEEEQDTNSERQISINSTPVHENEILVQGDFIHVESHDIQGESSQTVGYTPTVNVQGEIIPDSMFYSEDINYVVYPFVTNENSVLQIDKTFSMSEENCVTNLNISPQEMCSVTKETENYIKCNKEASTSSGKNVETTVGQTKTFGFANRCENPMSIAFGDFVGGEISAIEDAELFIETKHSIMKILMDSQMEQIRLKKQMMES